MSFCVTFAKAVFEVATLLFTLSAGVKVIHLMWRDKVGRR